MLKSLLNEFQKLRIIALNFGIMLLVGCGPANDATTTQPQAGEQGAAAAQSSGKDDGPELDAPLEEPDLPTESKEAGSNSDDAPAIVPAAEEAKAPVQP